MAAGTDGDIDACYERKTEMYKDFFHLACIMIMLNRVRNASNATLFCRLIHQ